MTQTLLALTVPSLRGARVILPAGPGPSPIWAANLSSHQGNNQSVRQTIKQPQGSPQSKGNKSSGLMLHILPLQVNSLIDTLGDSQEIPQQKQCNPTASS